MNIMAKVTSKDVFEMGIAVNKNLLQQQKWEDEKTKKTENRIYLKSGQQFEIFLKNYRNAPILIELEINGEQEPASLILDPKESIFLERYLSSKNKLIFNTYQMSAGLKALIESKVKLGVITARVYSVKDAFEKVIPASIASSGFKAYDSSTRFLGTGSGPINSLISGSSNMVYTALNTGNVFNAGALSYSTANIDYQLANSRQLIEKATAQQEVQTLSQKASIGAIEKGKYSDQGLDPCCDFVKDQYITMYNINIYPITQKELQIETSKKQGAVYCSVCGRRKKGNQKFCPEDGTKFGE